MAHPLDRFGPVSGVFPSQWAHMVLGAAERRGWPSLDYRSRLPELLPEVIGPGRESWATWVETADPAAMSEAYGILAYNGCLTQ